MTSIKTAQEELQSDKHITELSGGAIKYVNKPIGKALFKGTNDFYPPLEPATKKSPRDRLKCKKCGKMYTRWNKSSHERSKYHQMSERLIDKVIEYITGD